jgi:hypothetical protein
MSATRCFPNVYTVSCSRWKLPSEIPSTPCLPKARVEATGTNIVRCSTGKLKPLGKQERILCDGTMPLLGRVVAELTFGFWTRLISRDYEKTLWVPYLHKALPHLPSRRDRIAVFNRLDSIRGLRNRIAHHEKILSRNLGQDYEDIVETIGWICPTTAAWIHSTATFPREYSR